MKLISRKRIDQLLLLRAKLNVMYDGKLDQLVEEYMSGLESERAIFRLARIGHMCRAVDAHLTLRGVDPASQRAADEAAEDAELIAMLEASSKQLA